MRFSRLKYIYNQHFSRKKEQKKGVCLDKLLHFFNRDYPDYLASILAAVSAAIWFAVSIMADEAAAAIES